jgi:hypothetical protein
MKQMFLVAVLISVVACESHALEFPKFSIGERTCTLIVSKVKKDKKDRVTYIYGYRRTDKKKSKFEIDVNFKKADKTSQEVLSGAAKGDSIRVVYAWGLTGRYLVKARPFTEKEAAKEDEKIAKGEVEEGDDADDDDDDGEKAAGKPVTAGGKSSRPADAEADEVDAADEDEE